MSAALAEKLGIKGGQRVIVRRCPDELHADFRALGAAFDRGTIAEVTLSFVRAPSEIENACREALALTAPSGVLWMAYPAESPPVEWDRFAREGWHAESDVELGDGWIAKRFTSGR